MCRGVTKVLKETKLAVSNQYKLQKKIIKIIKEANNITIKISIKT